MDKKIKISAWVWIFGMLFHWACKPDIQATWEAEYATPIAHTELDLGDLVGDSLLVKKSDNSLDLVYDYTLLMDSVNDYLKVPDTLQEKSVTLSKIVLDNRALSDTITLGEIYPLSKLLDGQTQTLPAFDQDGSANKQEIDVTKQFFKQAKFKAGFIDMVLSNDLPVEAEKIVFQLLNKGDNQIIIYDSFLNVKPNTSVMTTKSLAGKKIDGILVGVVKRIKTLASPSPVLINSKEGIRLDLSIRDLELEYATAVFPAQNLIQENQEIQYNLGGAQVTYMEINSGFVVMEVYSNVKEEIILDYKIPHSMQNFDNKKFVHQTVKVPPATSGGYSKVVKKFPLDNYQVFMKGKNMDTIPYRWNTVYSEFTARIEYTGIERTLSLKDSVYIRFGLVEIKPKLAIGDFGIHFFTFDEQQPVKFFENVKGNISLEDVKMSLLFKNTFAIQADITVDNITSVNTRTNKSVKLSSTALPPTFLIDRAKNAPFIPFYYGMNFTTSNSNLKQFLENLPDRLDSKFSMEVRKRGSENHTDFVFDTSKLVAKLRLEMPVQFGSDGLDLSQVQPFNFAGFKNSENIKSGVLRLDISNGFPFEAGCDVEFLSENNEVLATLYEPGKMQRVLPGIIDVSGVVVSPVISQLFIEMPASKMQSIKFAKKIRIKAHFETPGGNRYKIYSHYKFGVKLKGNFVYEQGY